ncbi:hypothetical protein OGV35_11525, partial [Citrobacter sp. Cb016]|nr:hypothetical protein [Citrobacter sp. Cb016]
ADRNRSHWSTSKTPSYTKSVSWQHHLRTYWDSSKPDIGMVILGDYWPESQLTKDCELIVKILKEFFDTGNVSKELLN